MKLYTTIIILFLLVISCKQHTSEADHSLDNIVEHEKTEEQNRDVSQEASDNLMAGNIINFLTNDYLKEDLEFMEDKDRKFQFAEVDLNGDDKNEIFVRFMSPYFCGTGGCTFLLLSHEGDVITKFSVTRAPIWVEPTKANGWAILLTRNSGELKELKFSNGTYPSNPSVVKKAPYEAASGHATVLFDENFNPSDTITF